MEEGIVKAELAGDAVQTVHIAKLSVIDGIRSDNFNHFIENTVYEDNHHWPVAIMSPARGHCPKMPEWCKYQAKMSLDIASTGLTISKVASGN